MPTSVDLLIATLAGAAGVALKTVWDAVVGRRKDIEKAQWDTRLQDLREALSKFYWPIYLRLQRDNIIWRLILNRDSPDESTRKLARGVEERVILPNHREMLRILENNMHLAIPEEALVQEILKYVRHADLYISLRDSGVWDKDPLAFGEHWPVGFFLAIESRLRELQDEHDLILEKRKRSGGVVMSKDANGTPR